MYKVCTKCDIAKETQEFHSNSRNKKDGLHTWCKQCSQQYAKDKKNAAPIRNAKIERGRRLKRLYGMTVVEYDQLLKDQRNRCAICDTHQLDLDRKLFVDHCHATGKVRGLLCGNCNLALGLLKDSTKILFSAVKYLDSESVEQEQGYLWMP